MDIELVNNEPKHNIHKQSYFNGSVCVQELIRLTTKSFIKNKESYFDNRSKLDNLLEQVVNEAFSQGYYKGVRENGTNKKREKSVNNWNAEKVYPNRKGYQGD